MVSKLLQTGAAALVLAVALALGACGKEPSRWDNAQKESTQPKNEVVEKAKAEAQEGGSFNRFFPKGQDGYETVAAQEKTGFAEWKLKKSNKDMATLSINDLKANLDAAKKFQSSTKKVAGYPAVDQGNTASALLVADRYQVKVISKDPAFTKADRETWLQKFDLAGLSKVK
jgi:hypothetical protein